MVDHVLAAAATRTGGDGEPLRVDERVYAPRVAIRRGADHLVDHLAELETRLVGEDPGADRWPASGSTTDGDLAPFTAEDSNEARSRLVRPGLIWAARLGAPTEEQFDDSPGDGWSFREPASHLKGSTYYVDALGRLS
jgi:hypothetical protein